MYVACSLWSHVFRMCAFFLCVFAYFRHCCVFFVLQYFTFVFLSTVLVCVVLVMRVASYCRSAFWYVLCFGVCVCVYVKQ